jgi:hypothetical protein
MDALKETLSRDLAFFAPTQGLGVRPEPRNIFAREKPDAETGAAAPASVESGMSDAEIEAFLANSGTRAAAPERGVPAQGTSALDAAYVSGIGQGRGTSAQLQQVNDAIEKDPSMADKVVDWVVANPYDAFSLALMAVPGIGFAGNIGLKAIGAVARSPRVINAFRSLVMKPNPAFASVGPNLPGTAARLFSPGRASMTAGTVLTGAGQAYDRMGGEGDAATAVPTTATVDAAATPAAATPAAATAAPVPRDAVQTLLDRVPEAEALAAVSPSGPKNASEYLMAYGQAPERKTKTLATTAGTSDDRYDRMLAGLRGLGSLGLGGYAAGSAEEKLRMEQEAIAAQERQRTAGMEERELGLRDREVTLMDAMRRADAEDRRFNQVMNLAQGFTQLESNERQRLGAAVADATKPLSDQLMTVNTALAMGDLSGDDVERYEGLKNNLESQIANRVAETTTMFGEGLNYGPIIESLLRSAMPTSMGATASGMSEKQRSLLNMYAPQE